MDQGGQGNADAFSTVSALPVGSTCVCTSDAQQPGDVPGGARVSSGNFAPRNPHPPDSSSCASGSSALAWAFRG